MLVEYHKVRQEPGAGRRRWFEGASYGLVVWYRLDGAGLQGFQIIYCEALGEHALTWREGEGFTHNRVDSGSASPFKNLTPILVSDGNVPWAAVQREFDANSAGLEPDLREFVRQRLEARA